MAANTILLDFSVDAALVKTESQMLKIIHNVESVLRDFLSNFKNINSLSYQGGLVKLYTSDPGATIQLRIYNNGLITINLDYFKADNQNPILSYDVSTLTILLFPCAL